MGSCECPVYTYYMILTVHSSKHHFQPVSPSVFTVGQLVEVQVSFVVVPVSKRVWKMILKLRSICILNRIIQEVRVSSVY